MLDEWSNVVIAGELAKLLVVISFIARQNLDGVRFCFINCSAICVSCSRVVVT